MIDTIRVKYALRPTETDLKNFWSSRSTRTPKGQNTYYTYNPTVGETTLRFTYIPYAYDGSEMFTLEFSLPKLLFDNNYQMISSIDGSIKIANILLDNFPHVPKFDLAEGILIRLDVCYNHRVGEAVDDYIKALGNLDYPHRRTKHHRHEGVEFRAKHKTTKFYNKEHESGFTEAHGILRQEITLIKSKDVQVFLHNPQPTLFDVSPELVADELRNDLSKLRLLDNSIATQETALNRLCKEYGELAGVYYHGLLMNKAMKSKKRILKETKMHPRSLDRKLRKITDVNIPLTVTDREEPLPPLEINL